MSKKNKRSSRKSSYDDIELAIIGEKNICIDDNEKIDKISPGNVFKKSDYEAKIALYEELLKSKEDLIKAKDVIITELNEKVVLLREKIEFLSENVLVESESTKTYSEALQKTENVAAQREENIQFKLSPNNSLTIKPLNTQDNQITRNELGKHINPALMKVEITRIINLKDGAVKIHCGNKEDIKKIQNEAVKKLGQNYIVQEVQKKRPKIKVVGMEENMSEENLKQNILKKNDFLENPNLKIITVRKMKHKYMAIIETDALNFKNIMDKGYLFIGFSVCSVYEHLDVLRCFQCAGYNHLAKNCTKEQVCLKCGHKGHTATACTTFQENSICPNCCEMNMKNNSGYSVNHSPFDLNCRVFKMYSEKARNKIEYNSE